jgi:hypothetical protein
MSTRQDRRELPFPRPRYTLHLQVKREDSDEYLYVRWTEPVERHQVPHRCDGLVSDLVADLVAGGIDRLEELA